MKDIEKSHATMTGRCKAGTTVTKMKGTYGDFKMWINKKGITNFIYIPMLEANGYIVLTHTHADWVMTTPEGKDITFKRDKGVCTGMTYIDLHEKKEGILMIETFQENMRGHTPEQIKGDQLARVAQGHVGHPLDGVLKKMVSDNTPKHMFIGFDNVADALDIYGPPGSRLKRWKLERKPNRGLGKGGFLSFKQICDPDGRCDVCERYPIPSHFLDKYQNDYCLVCTKSYCPAAG